MYISSFQAYNGSYHLDHMEGAGTMYYESSGNKMFSGRFRSGRIDTGFMFSERSKGGSVVAAFLNGSYTSIGSNDNKSGGNLKATNVWANDTLKVEEHKNGTKEANSTWWDLR